MDEDIATEFFENVFNKITGLENAVMIIGLMSLAQIVGLALILWRVW